MVSIIDEVLERFKSLSDSVLDELGYVLGSVR
ncbi:MAG: hypothetical protein MAG451_01182 [Anaerolineales bacterium]|nr:hypothetical protein [Anaerolineales bacterium]